MNGIQSSRHVCYVCWARYSCGYNRKTETDGPNWLTHTQRESQWVKLSVRPVFAFISLCSVCVLESLCPPVVRPTDSFRILTDPPSSSRKVAYVCVRAASRDSTTVPRLFEPLLFLFWLGCCCWTWLFAFLLFGPARRLFCSDALLIPAFGSYSSIMQQQPPTEIFASWNFVRDWIL